MPTGNETSILSFLRAGTLAGCPYVEQVASTVRKVTVPPAESATSLSSPLSPSLSSSSCLWPLAFCNFENCRQEKTLLWATALRHKAITAEAKKLGLDALQRGEVRRRAKLSFHVEGRHKCGPNDTASDAEKHTLADILREEVDGCRAWTDVANGTRFQMSFLLGGGDTVGVAKEMSALEATMSGQGDTSQANRIRLLVCAVAVVSAMLNHFCPLRWVITAYTGVPHVWDQAIALVEQLLNDEAIVSFFMAEALASAIMSVSSSDVTMRRYDVLLKEKRKRMLTCILPLQHVLGGGEAAPLSIAGVAKNTLHLRTETQLLDLKRGLQKELRERLAIASKLDQRSVDRARQFKEACELYRATVKENETDGRHPILQKKGLTALSRTDILPGRCVHLSDLPAGNKLRTETKRKLSCETETSTHEAKVTSSCWERTVLEVWRARREAVLGVLRGYWIVDNGSLRRKGIEKKTETKEKAGSLWMTDALLGTLSRQLLALIGVQGQNLISSLDSLWRWIGCQRDALDEEMYTALAVELVVFLLVAKYYSSRADNLLSELMAILKHLAGIRVRDDFSSPLLQKVPDALAVVLFDAVFFSLSTGISCFSEGNSDGSRERRLSSHVSTLLWELQSSVTLRHAVSILQGGSSRQLPTGNGGVNPLSLTPSLGDTEELTLLTDVARHGRCGGVALNVSPRHDVCFLLTLTEFLGTSVFAHLKEIPIRAKRPPPRFLSEALWNALLPLTSGLLHHIQRMHIENGAKAVRRFLEFSRALVEELTPRWEYNIVPTRRLQKKGVNIFTYTAVEQEYEANHVVEDRVVKFTSLLEWLLMGASEFFPELLTDDHSFSRMCNAVGLILYDVDGRTGHQIMTHLLRLVPPKEKMDIEAYIAAIRCLSSMRHGCTLWEEAVKYYREAVYFMEDDANAKDAMNSHRRPHVPADLSTARVLRCIGSSPLPHVPRCTLTLQIVAFARASGVPLSLQSYSSCLINFTLRKNPPTKAFFVAPWCDALEWYNDVMPRSEQVPLPKQDPLCFQVACLQSLLAQGDWPEALFSLPLADIVRQHGDDAAELNLSQFSGKVSFLLRLCASDRTRSCAHAANSLLYVFQTLPSLKPGTQAANLEDMQKLCHVANTYPPVLSEPKLTNGAPLFRHEAPLIPRISLELEVEWARSLEPFGFSFCHFYHIQDSLMEKLEAAILSRLHRRKSGTDGRDGKDSDQPSAIIRVRERVSCAFPLLQTVWSAEEFLKKTKEADCVVAGGDDVRSRMDTCYASVMLPLRRLERIRAEKRRGMRRRDPSSRQDRGRRRETGRNE
ncbi:hypothetical protein TcBrA4_0106690 [Trypanosoma cruzi]|nr:hypothetical protein TcBrA4_0106690 [Trypanosoma cruzi]